MTHKEFRAAYKAAQESIRSLSIKMTQKIHSIYNAAAKQVADYLRNTEAGPAQDRLLQMEAELMNAADGIVKGLDGTIRSAMKSAVDKNGAPIQKSLEDAILKAGIKDIEPDTIEKMMTYINEMVVANTINRVFQSGYTYSSLIWKQSSAFQKDIKNVVSLGQVLGRSTIEIAADIQKYTKDGLIQLAKRYGPNLVKGDVDSFRKGEAQRIDWKEFEKVYGEEATKKAKDFMRRIGTTVDYRALRLARTEYGLSLKSAAVQQAAANPATTGEFDWITRPGACEICLGIAEEGPYTQDEINNIIAEIHPNDMCYVVPKLRNERDFQNDLKEWASGKMVDYLDDWFNNQYSRSA